MQPARLTLLSGSAGGEREVSKRSGELTGRMQLLGPAAHAAMHTTLHGEDGMEGKVDSAGTVALNMGRQKLSNVLSVARAGQAATNKRKAEEEAKRAQANKAQVHAEVQALQDEIKVLTRNFERAAQQSSEEHGAELQRTTARHREELQRMLQQHAKQLSDAQAQAWLAPCARSSGFSTWWPLPCGGHCDVYVSQWIGTCTELSPCGCNWTSRR